jgi:hypothetical protein
MTAEIVALNQGAVALAADSAVTVGSRSLFGTQSKVFRSADKLFALSHTQPIAVMCYGNAELMGIPWETVFKGYRSHLKDTVFPRVADYAADFLDYAGCYQKHVTEEELERFIEGQVGVALRAWEVMADRADMEDPSLADLEEAARDLEEALKTGTPCKGITGDYLKTLKGMRLTAVQDYLEDGYRADPLPAALSRRLHRIGQLAISWHLDGRPGPFSTGLVFAGFGEEEIFPCMRAYELTGLLTPKGPCAVLDRATDVDPIDGTPVDFAACIHSFAQGETVHAFMSGLEPSMQNLVVNLVKGTLHEMSNNVMLLFSEMDSDSRADLKENLEEMQEELLDDFEELLEDDKQEKFVEPILAMVRLLPKYELAAAAEALVALQSLKRRVTLVTESVSGPVDVAVITKGDGFSWVKKKSPPG